MIVTLQKVFSLSLSQQWLAFKYGRREGTLLCTARMASLCSHFGRMAKECGLRSRTETFVEQKIQGWPIEKAYEMSYTAFNDNNLTCISYENLGNTFCIWASSLYSAIQCLKLNQSCFGKLRSVLCIVALSTSQSNIKRERKKSTFMFINMHSGSPFLCKCLW